MIRECYEFGKNKIAQYFVSYDERNDPAKWDVIKEDMDVQRKEGRVIVCAYSTVVKKPNLADIQLAYENIIARWEIVNCVSNAEEYFNAKKQGKIMQRKEIKLSIKYSFFTEIKIDGRWTCINDTAVQREPYYEKYIVPTYENSSRRYFEKAYNELIADGHLIKIDEISENLRNSIRKFQMSIENPSVYIYYENILSHLKCTGKEHYGFALRQEIADFENGVEDEIYDVASVAEYKAMDSELKKAYQYYEWNDRTGVYHYYDTLRKNIDEQLNSRKEKYPNETIEDIRLIMFIG